MMFYAISRWAFLAAAVLMLAEAVEAQEFDLPPVEVVWDVPAEPAPPVEPSPASPRPAEGPRETPAQEPQKPKIAPDSVEGILQRFHEVQLEIARKKNQPAPEQPGKDKPILVLENPHLSQGRYHGNNQYDRSFVVKLLIANPTGKDVELKRAGVTLTSDQKTYKAAQRLTVYHDSYNIGRDYVSISSLTMNDTVPIPAGQSASAWLLFEKLPMNPAVPDLKLTLEFGSDKREIDVNEFCEGLLKSRIERMGPKDCLAVVTIEGQLDPVNVKSLVDDLDDLAVNQKLARVVIRWGKDGAAVETQLMEWLQRSANEAGQIRPANQNPSNSYPIVPMSIRELHLAELPKDSARYTSSNSQGRVHKGSAEAIIAALRTAYQALSANEIVDDLRDPNPLIRSAALMGGGGRLPPEKLPVLLDFIHSGDRNLERAAIFALRNFGEKESIETLVGLVKKNEKPRSVEAAESLATSRFAVASEALLELLKTADPEVKTSIVEVLAKYPRPIWADTIAEYARRPETPIGMASLRALNGIGHPELLSMLKHALEQKSPQVQMEAFNMLAARKDQESEELAVEFTLKHLRTEPPVGQMSNLIIRTKEPRAIPLLMRQFQAKKGSRYSLINMLASIGDDSVVEMLVSEYPKLNNSEKRAVLQGLQQLHSPEYVRLASEALLINDSSLLNAAAEGLYRDGTPQAEKALIEALKKDAKHSYWGYICNALVNFATPEARAALREARNSEHTEKKNAAINALRSLQQRSPGNQYMHQARSYARQKQWDQAIRYYTLAIEADSEYAEAHAGRGTAHLNKDKLKEAKADFERAVKSDPESSQGHTGLAILKILDGKIEKGVEYAESSRKEIEPFENNKGMMLYNLACVYGRAVGKLEDSPPRMEDEKRAKLLKQYQTKAVETLNEAVKNHFSDFELMKIDPDLEAVRDLPDIQKLLPDAQKGDKKRPNLRAEKVPVQDAAF